MCVVTWHELKHIFSERVLNGITPEKMDEFVDTQLHYSKAIITISLLADISNSLQFFHSELALTTDPMMRDALNLRGSLKEHVLKNANNIASEYICMTHSGKSLCWLNANMTLSKLKLILKKNGSNIVVANN